MKKFILFVFVLFGSVVMASADNDTPITIDQLPTPAKEFINKYFPDTKVSYAKKETKILGNNYEVIFTEGQKVEFDGKGEWKEVKCKFAQVPEGIVPQKIKEYVATNYPEAKIIKIDRDRKDYEVELNNKLELKFDLQFKLIGIDD